MKRLSRGIAHFADMKTGEMVFNWSRDLWECENCHNESIKKPRRRFIDYDDYNDDEYCDDGIPDVNQGWVGENYG